MRRTVVRARDEVERDALLVSEETVMGPEPSAVLRVRARVVGQPTEPDIASDRGEVSAGGMNDLVDPLHRACVNTSVTQNRHTAKKNKARRRRRRTESYASLTRGTIRMRP